MAMELAETACGLMAPTDLRCARLAVGPPGGPAPRAPHPTEPHDRRRRPTGRPATRPATRASRARRAIARLAGGVGDQADLTIWLLRWIALGIGVGVLAGLSSALFLFSLEWATDTFAEHGWLLWLLPVGGLAMGCLYHYAGGRAIEGNTLVIDEIHEPRAGVPGRMAPFVLLGTIVTHLFGGSAGREGTAIQMSASLTATAARYLRVSTEERRTLLVAGIAAGFGSVFGVPLAGAVFGLEVQSVGRVRYEALVPALTGSLVGNLIVRGLGVTHTPTPQLGPGRSRRRPDRQARRRRARLRSRRARRSSRRPTW